MAQFSSEPAHARPRRSQRRGIWAVIGVLLLAVLVAGSHFGASTANVPGLNHTVYIAVTALVINLVVAIVLTAVFRLMRLPAGADETQPAHYLAGDDGKAVEPVPVTTAAAGTG